MCGKTIPAFLYYILFAENKKAPPVAERVRFELTRALLL